MEVFDRVTLLAIIKYPRGSVWSKMGIFNWVVWYVKVLQGSFQPDMFLRFMRAFKPGTVKPRKWRIFSLAKTPPFAKTTIFEAIWTVKKSVLGAMLCMYLDHLYPTYMQPMTSKFWKNWQFQRTSLKEQNQYLI